MIEPLRAALEQHPAVRSARLAGSRSRDETPTPLSDWDIEVETDDFPTVAADLPSLVGVLHPLAQQWDPYGPDTCYMLMLPRGVKVDLIFPEVPNEVGPSWDPRPNTLEPIDRHFWDWILWLGSKILRGEADRVQTQFELMWEKLLGPLGVSEVPSSVEDAVAHYRAARDEFERRLEIEVPREVEKAVLAALGRAGFAV
jgi:hypothetical protein